MATCASSARHFTLQAPQTAGKALETMQSQQQRRLQVLAGQMAALDVGSQEAVVAEPAAALQDGYSVILPETLTGNNWVVRRQVTALPVGTLLLLLSCWLCSMWAVRG
jgi:hypothetical protein